MYVIINWMLLCRKERKLAHTSPLKSYWDREFWCSALFFLFLTLKMQFYPVQAFFTSMFCYHAFSEVFVWSLVWLIIIYFTKQHYHYLFKIAFTKYNIQSYWMQEFTRDIVMDLGWVSVLNTLSTEINQIQVVETSPIKRFLLLTTFHIWH